MVLAAWFDSGYMSMRWYWGLSGRIPHNFYVLAQFARNLIWHPLCAMSVTPEEYRNIGVSGRLFHEFFLRSLVSDRPLFGAGPAEKHRNLFWETTSGAVSAFVVRQSIHALLRLSSDWGESHVFIRAGGPRIPRSTLFVAQCLARQWLHVMRQFGCSSTYFGVFFLREDGTSDPEVDSVLLSGVSWYGEVCTVDAPVTWKSGYHFHEPLASCSHLSAVRAFPQTNFWERSMARSCELWRAWGGGDAGSQTPRCSATLVRCIRVQWSGQTHHC